MYDELIKSLRNYAEVYKLIGNENTYEYPLLIKAADAIEKLSKERKKGRWITDGEGCHFCSECGNPAEINCITGEFMDSPYCSQCGADMR